MDSLSDPKTGKCCPNRCHAAITKSQMSLDNLVNQVLNTLSRRTNAAEDKLSEHTKDCCDRLTNRVEELEKKLDQLHRQTQNPIISRLANAQARAEQLMQSPTPESQSEQEQEPESQSERTPENESQSQQRQESESTSIRSPGSVSKSTSEKETPTSPRPSEGNIPRGGQSRKKGEECLEIDLCEPLYVFLRQWQEQSNKQNQSLSEAYRECCNPAQAASKKPDEEQPKLVATADASYEQPLIEEN